MFKEKEKNVSLHMVIDLNLCFRFFPQPYIKRNELLIQIQKRHSRMFVCVFRMDSFPDVLIKYGQRPGAHWISFKRAWGHLCIVSSQQLCVSGAATCYTNTHTFTPEHARNGAHTRHNIQDYHSHTCVSLHVVGTRKHFHIMMNYVLSRSNGSLALVYASTHARPPP